MKYKLIIDPKSEEEIIAIVHTPNQVTEQIENLVLSYTGKDKITGFRDDGITQLCFTDIECITVIDRRIIAIDVQGEKYRINQRLCELEQFLPSYFIRINKSTLANKNCIIRFDTVFSGAVDAIFKCGYKEYVSRRCFSEIKRRLGI
ncbi:MAG: LytTR family DNA-binding domain-containing protein [Acutalibacteraceae bacterium]|nr:LytTR family DNA-binding domain-containing protein [Acutalibacteraceae bacterium]